MRIAILEDEPAQQQHLQQVLEQQLSSDTDEVVCHLFSDGEALRRALRRESFDLLMMDWSMPGIDGLDLVRWLRGLQNNPVPVIMLSARASEHDVAHALMAGADDYIVKPFRRLELRARILKLLRRQPIRSLNASREQRFGRWGFDRSRHAISLHATSELDSPLIERHVVSSRQFVFAHVLFSNMGRTISRAHLLELAGYDSDALAGRALDSQIYRLRKDLGLGPERGVGLQTIYGKGYRLEELSTHLGRRDEKPEGSLEAINTLRFGMNDNVTQLAA